MNSMGHVAGSFAGAGAIMTKRERVVQSLALFVSASEMRCSNVGCIEAEAVHANHANPSG